MAGVSLNARVGDEKFHRSFQLERYNFSKLRHSQILDSVTEKHHSVLIRKTVLFASLHNMFTRGQFNGCDMNKTAAEIHFH